VNPSGQQASAAWWWPRLVTRRREQAPLGLVVLVAAGEPDPGDQDPQDLLAGVAALEGDGVADPMAGHRGLDSGGQTLVGEPGVHRRRAAVVAVASRVVGGSLAQPPAAARRRAASSSYRVSLLMLVVVRTPPAQVVHIPRLL
jgi:hypothetical protein